MSFFPNELPALDCHAHIAPDVTSSQIDALNGAVVFAVSRTPAETSHAVRRQDPTLVWGTGVHPAMPAALKAFTPQQFRTTLKQTCLIGEVGLDRRGSLELQRSVLTQILAIARDEPVILSLHSSGRSGPLIDLLTSYPHPGIILHWFLGSPAERQQAISLGAYFSVNAAMPDDILAALPLQRLLPETDFPASRRATGATRPGAVGRLEHRLAELNGTTPQMIRHRFWQNLRELTTRTQTLDRLPEPVAHWALEA
ncbi:MULTISPECIES: TatD family hydrolase [Streptomyces griseus group]|uniref:TatD family hydrolase n=1 Tax=Streptomyces griseus group TaxID=629295 RepID=UPI002E0D6EF4|nr:MULTISPECIES: TatD family hydrolase [Streptomyces griseus group]WSI46079.1 TatD family hydrolase [Streptomyces cyaneofuscatus]WSI52668.1 TatD family hydrolase [Streptomyces cyaneofuscatus]